MYYCSNCDGKNEKSATYCVHCNALILEKEKYIMRVEELENNAAGEKQAAVIAIWFMVILIAIFIASYLGSL